MKTAKRITLGMIKVVVGAAMFAWRCLTSVPALFFCVLDRTIEGSLINPHAFFSTDWFKHVGGQTFTGLMTGMCVHATLVYSSLKLITTGLADIFMIDVFDILNFNTTFSMKSAKTAE